MPQPRGSSTIVSGQTAMSGTAAPIVAFRQDRGRVTLINTSSTAAEIVYIGPATPALTSSNGFPLAAGASITLETTALVQGVAASGTPTVAYLEELR